MCMIDRGDIGAVCQMVRRKARIIHSCSECVRDISPGEHYKKHSSLLDGRWEHYKHCEHCDVIARWLSQNCGGYIYTAVVEDMREHLEKSAEFYPISAMARIVVGANRKWRKFHTDGLMPVPPLPAAIRVAS